MIFIDGFTAIIIFLLGLSVGSFLNVLIYRLEIDKSVFKGRSFCSQCKTTLGWLDLIPVVSFVLIKGKCRYCKKPISWQYPIVELAVGFLFFIIANFFFVDESIMSLAQTIYLWIASSLLVVIFVYDFKHLEVPDILVVLGVGVTLIASFFGKITLSGGILQALLGTLICAGFFFALVVISRERWMGWGDVKLGLFLGLLLGWQKVLVAMFLAFFIGAICGIILIMVKKKGMKSQMPFGPFLVISTFIAIFFSAQLINWYLNILYL
ncbi:MAG: prepilin peptidase [Candidatus Portnoybacteria bacterium CG10_big_fil_rev_8_21_14_0_10_36_7]|uniref:Prepilin peptidase n=1 Tax=Candidatus Portnoybacteria bacterium CG10_big_fil_rev_8_21_14_0_10_36_7 TaxID=1974812 RepID=A0A2M8KDM7_9BACT|nr:MAG: prepilin peptidase [Candidatus Portnoybacteria bacterium CG10_big_fil_rev_8_21_14_0_10_36_7]